MMTRILSTLCLFLLAFGCSDTVDDRKGDSFFGANNFDTFNNENNQNNENNDNNQNNQNNLNNGNNCGGCSPAPLCGDVPDLCSCPCEDGEISGDLICANGCFEPRQVDNAFIWNIGNNGLSSFWSNPMTIRTEDGQRVELECASPEPFIPQATETRPGEELSMFWDGSAVDNRCDKEPVPAGVYIASWCYGETTDSSVFTLDRMTCLEQTFELRGEEVIRVNEVEFTATEINPTMKIALVNDTNAPIYFQEVDDCWDFSAWAGISLRDGTELEKDYSQLCNCPCARVSEVGLCDVVCPQAIACALPRVGTLQPNESVEFEYDGYRESYYPIDAQGRVCYQPQYVFSDFVVEACVGDAFDVQQQLIESPRCVQTLMNLSQSGLTILASQIP